MIWLLLVCAAYALALPIDKVPWGPQFWTITLYAMLGQVVGILLGTLASPEKGDEETAFQGFAKTLGTFVSGYLASRIDQFFHGWQNDPLIFAKLSIFAICCILSIVNMYILRKYVLPELEKP